MEAGFNLVVNPNHQKTVWSYVILLIFSLLPLFLLILFVGSHGDFVESIQFEISYPIYLVVLFVLAIVIIKRDYFFDEISLTDDAIESSKLGSISYAEIVKHRIFKYRGYKCYILKLESGKKITLAPKNVLSNKSYEQFFSFIKLFEENRAKFL